MDYHIAKGEDVCRIELLMGSHRILDGLLISCRGLPFRPSLGGRDFDRNGNEFVRFPLVLNQDNHPEKPFQIRVFRRRD
jgi:hypothetical protein